MLQLAWNHNTICGGLCFSFLFFPLQIQVRLKLSDDAQTSPERVGVGILWTDMARCWGQLHLGGRKTLSPLRFQAPHSQDTSVPCFNHCVNWP